jgi:hypothetical protein
MRTPILEAVVVTYLIAESDGFWSVSIDGCSIAAFAHQAGAEAFVAQHVETRCRARRVSLVIIEPSDGQRVETWCRCIERSMIGSFQSLAPN